jgi:hypothetical protein
LRTPATIAFQPAPGLSTPAVIAVQPTLPLSTPAALPAEPVPTLSVPATLPLQPAPPLSTPATIALQSPPPLTVPATLPAEPVLALTVPAALPFQPPPGLSAPATLPAPPRFAQPPSHADLVNAATDAQNSIPGMLAALGSQIVSSFAAAAVTEITNTGLSAASSLAAAVGLPGIVPIPLDTPDNTHVDKINAGLDPQSQALPVNLSAVAISYAQAKAQALGATVASGGLAQLGISAVPVRPAAIPALPILSNTPAPSASQTGLLPTPTLAAGNAPLPDLQVDPVDDVFTYNADSRQRAQMTQQLAANQNDATMGTDPAAPYKAASTLWDAFNNEARDPLMAAFNAAPSSSNKITANIPRTGNATENRGFFLMSSGSTARNTLPDDDAVYLPLVFTDLRPMGRGGKYRVVYFRPFIKSITESLAPSWNMTNYFGRVDPVATYQNTNRTISLAFQVTCFSHEELIVVYQKLGWLRSMTYPLYVGGEYHTGPVIRLRVGDLINAIGTEGGRGVPGVITSLEFDYNEAIWELNKNEKVPRIVEVSLGFQALHEYAIGLVTKPGQAGQSENTFGGIYSSGSGKNYKEKIDYQYVQAAFSGDFLNDPTLTGLSSSISGAGMIPSTTTP